MLVQLEHDLTNKYSAKVAQFAVVAVKESHKLLSTLHSESKDRLNQNVSGAPIRSFAHDLDAITKHVKDAIHNSAVFRQMTQAAENHFKNA